MTITVDLVVVIRQANYDNKAYSNLLKFKIPKIIKIRVGMNSTKLITRVDKTYKSLQTQTKRLKMYIISMIRYYIISMTRHWTYKNRNNSKLTNSRINQTPYNV